jgi:methylenetetrahydrofolate dehydrogenase (NADP+)/methenyltetrahydrofolate cyclohydrolase
MSAPRNGLRKTAGFHSESSMSSPVDAAQADLLTLIDRLNADPAIHGILVQLPLAQTD